MEPNLPEEPVKRHQPQTMRCDVSKTTPIKRASGR